MIALIEQMVLTIESGGKSHKENVEYAEEIIRIIKGGNGRIESNDIAGDDRSRENGDDNRPASVSPQRLRSTGNIPTNENYFVKEERIGED